VAADLGAAEARTGAALKAAIRASAAESALPSDLAVVAALDRRVRGLHVTAVRAQPAPPYVVRVEFMAAAGGPSAQDLFTRCVLRIAAEAEARVAGEQHALAVAASQAADAAVQAARAALGEAQEAARVTTAALQAHVALAGAEEGQ
jgi:hypothetical protein